MTIQDAINSDGIMCKFCCDLETLKKHYYRNHNHCMTCEKTFDDNDGIIDHLLIKHGQRFQCEYCPFFNFDANEVDIHMENCWNKNEIQDQNEDNFFDVTDEKNSNIYSEESSDNELFNDETFPVVDNVSSVAQDEIAFEDLTILDNILDDASYGKKIKLWNISDNKKRFNPF